MLRVVHSFDPHILLGNSADQIEVLLLRILPLLVQAGAAANVGLRSLPLVTLIKIVL